MVEVCLMPVLVVSVARAAAVHVEWIVRVWLVVLADQSTARRRPCAFPAVVLVLFILAGCGWTSMNQKYRSR